MPELDAVLQPRAAREREVAPFPLILEGELATQAGSRFLRIETTALWGPVMGADGLADGSAAVVAVSQEGVPYVVSPRVPGSTGPTGPTGPAGPAGPPGTVDYTRTLQLDAAFARTTRVIWGQVNADGSINRDGSGGWTCVKGSAGAYTINTSTINTQAWVITANPTLAGYIRVFSSTGTSFGINTYNTSGAFTDIAFTFIAIGRP